MGMPVKLSDEIVKSARKEAEAADRSITAQIEHWAKLGQSVERVLRHEDTLVLKRSGGDLAAFLEPSIRQWVYTTVRNVALAKDQPALSRSLREGRVVYQSDPDGSGRIMRIKPGGKRTLGRFEKRRFVAARSTRRRSTR